MSGRRPAALIVLGLLALGSTVSLAAEVIDPGARALSGITAQRLWTYAHLLLFVFWLGADLGVFLCARAVVQPGLTPEQLLRTADLMRTIDLAPRISASLMLTVGGILSEYVGLAHPWWQMGGIVLLGPAWLSLVLIGYFRDGSALGDTVVRLDEAFRAMLVVAVPVSVAWSWTTGRLDAAPYVGAKLLIFALLILLGLVLRRRLRPFTAGLRALARGDAGPGVEAGMRAGHSQTRGLVIAIWVGLALAALLGIARPGEAPAPAAAGLSARSLVPPP